jgi:hypothetical protein
MQHVGIFFRTFWNLDDQKWHVCFAFWNSFGIWNFLKFGGSKAAWLFAFWNSFGIWNFLELGRSKLNDILCA